MNKFKDTINRFRTVSLFKETAKSSEFVIFTMEEARVLFVASDDPTGYKFATEHLGGWKHWLELRESNPVNKYIEQWLDELDVKLRSMALGNMLKLSQGDKGYQANKFLVDGGWKQKTAGRPTKAAIQKETQVRSKAYEEFNTVVDLKPH